MHSTLSMRSVFIVFLLIALSIGVKAQQDPQFTHNMFNQAFVNPGSYGLSDGITVTGIFREQWVGFKDSQGVKVSPETFLLTADAPIKFLRGGIGVGIAQDKEAYTKNMLVKLGYAYHLNIGNGKLGIGVNANFNNKSIDKDKFIAVDDIATDPVLSGLTSSGVMIADMSVGLFLQKPRYYIGLSSTQVFETKKSPATDAGIILYKNVRHYYLTGGHDIILPAFQGYVFTPSVFLKTDGNIIQADINIMAKYNNKVWGGLTYRINDAVALMVGVAYKDIEIGYAYDIPTSKVAATGSHEIMARYRFKLEREKTRSGYRNTRYL